MGTLHEKYPGDSGRHVSRDEERDMKMYIGGLHSFPTASSCFVVPRKQGYTHPVPQCDTLRTKINKVLELTLYS